MELESNTFICPPSPQYAKWGWCAAMTLQQNLVCRECRKVAQRCLKLLKRDTQTKICAVLFQQTVKNGKKNNNIVTTTHESLLL
jgi:hypothetical protein